MTYTKPEVSVLGDAKVLIETLQQKIGVPPDSNGSQLDGPAYDLDE